MHFLAFPIIAALASLNSVYAVTLGVANGCIVYTDVNGDQNSLCKGETGEISDIGIDVKACVDANAGTSACSLSVLDINMSAQVFWGTDDCLYNAGTLWDPAPSQITCATRTNPPEKLPFNPYVVGFASPVSPESPIITPGFRFARDARRNA
ncbi:alpha-galactosidase [Physcia stellaris]|nr:alpha-galactosidase [Physcia stellaris]